MTGLIAYMTFLSDPAQNPLAIAPPANAFPTLPNGVGRASQGAETYLQKCAFCHGKNGEGRYMDNTYFRPALWGAQSYNHRAGMSAAGDLAPFIYGNMPLHSGGELTSQEAMDLACYIDTQPRPAGGTTESTVSSTGTLTCAPN